MSTCHVDNLIEDGGDERKRRAGEGCRGSIGLDNPKTMMG